jgi:hypothetical protein
MVTIHDYVYARLLFKFMILFKLLCYYKYTRYSSPKMMITHSKMADQNYDMDDIFVSHF